MATDNGRPRGPIGCRRDGELTARSHVIWRETRMMFRLAYRKPLAAHRSRDWDLSSHARENTVAWPSNNLRGWNGRQDTNLALFPTRPARHNMAVAVNQMA
jgi:hypothetical protein